MYAVLLQRLDCRLAAIARREGVSASDALDVVQDAFYTLLKREDLRDKSEDAARMLSTIVRNAARNARRRHHHAKPHVDEAAGALGVTPGHVAVLLHRARKQLEACMATEP